MQRVYPDYYKDFKCIAEKCRHNCCIGWEIDIDPDTAAYYDTVTGEMGKRLQQNISQDGEPHFILGENDRCPFLNDRNLCDIILTLGEEHICGICTDHPRFRNELPDRIETGLGLCCEEAARLILGRKEPVTLDVHGEPEFIDEYVCVRDDVFEALQDQSRSIPERISEMLSICYGELPDVSMGEWAEKLLSLERLDDAWTETLTMLRDNFDSADIDGFDVYMAQRQGEYEQLLVYLIYRHLASAQDDFDFSARAAFAAFGYELLHTIGACIWTLTGEFTFEQQVELARQFSSEIEYSDENLDIILAELS